MNLRTEILRLDAAVAEVLIVAEGAVGGELRGRLSGPSCPGADTIEIAYELKPVAGTPIAARVVIPEPNFWDEETPYVYRGTIERWQDGVRHDVARLEIGLKAGKSSTTEPA